MKPIIIVVLTLLSLNSYASSKIIITADTTRLSTENAIYNVLQDDSYVYLNISTSDKKTAMSILRNGLTIYYDINGNENKDVYIKYPHRNNPSQMRQGPQLDNDANSIDLNTVIITLPREAEYGSFEEKQTFYKDQNSLDITIETNYSTSTQLFEFAIKTPKTRIANLENTDFSNLSIGVVSTKMEGNFNKQNGQDQGLKSGGRKGNGKGRGGKGRQNGERPNSTSERVSVDFWFDAK